MGSSDGENEKYFWRYYCWYPILVLARLAQLGFSCMKFFCGLLMGDAAATAVFLCALWRTFLFGYSIGMECWAIFRWIIWIHSYFWLESFNLIVGMQYAFVNSIWLENTFSGHIDKFKHSHILVYDERFLVLSTIMIHADVVYIFCNEYTSWKI